MRHEHTQLMSTSEARCDWVTVDPQYIRYHDEEWGRPVHDEHRLFEMLSLEGAQAGLSWLTILRKRDGYRALFREFEPATIAQFGPADIERLVQDSAIVRHRGKIESVIHNARCILQLHEQGRSLGELSWASIGGTPRINHWRQLSDVPSATPESTALSKQLKELGFRFVGPTTCYAFMQAAGLVNDHLTHCFCHPVNLR